MTRHFHLHPHLTAEELKLPVQPYDPRKHYNEVRNKWIGFGSKGE